MTKINPILRYAGSKYRKLDLIFKLLDLQKGDTFFDGFGGSLIVGVNAWIYCGNVIINDYDKVVVNGEIPKDFIVDNMCRYDGYGSYSKAAAEYFLRRVKNNFWAKVATFNMVLNWCEIISENFTSKIVRGNKVYLDPPYYDVKGFYKNTIDKEIYKDIATNLLNYDGVVLVSLNDHPEVRELFKDWTIIEEPFQYQSGKAKTRKKVNELFIINKGAKNV